MTHKYIGTKEICAAKIRGIGSLGHPTLRRLALCVSDRETRFIDVKLEWVEKHKPEEGGYLVEYEDGYQSYSPAKAFESAYRVVEGDDQALTFGDALHFLKQGRRVARRGWNGKGMWLAMSPGVRQLPADQFWAGPNRDFAEGRPGGVAEVLPCVTMKTATGEILMGWLASQTDMLAEDWVVLP